MLVQQLAPDVLERNFAKLPLTRKEIDGILRAAPDVATVMNARHAIAKEHGWKDKAPSKTAFLAAALKENKLLRRPILVAHGKVVVGRDLDGIRYLLGT